MFYTPYEEDPIQLTFYEVIDGECGSHRYECDEALTGVYVTYIRPQ